MHFYEAALAWCQLPPAMAMTNVVRTRSDLTSMLKIRRASIDDPPTVLNLVPRLIDFGPSEWRDPDEMSRADFEVIEKALQSTNDAPAIHIAELYGGIAVFTHLQSVVDYYRLRHTGHVTDLVAEHAAE